MYFAYVYVEADAVVVELALDAEGLVVFVGFYVFFLFLWVGLAAIERH